MPTPFPRRSLTLRVAHAAATAPVTGVDPRVRLGELVAVEAVGARTERLAHAAAADVYRVGNGVEVVRVHAGAISTEVVND